MRCPYCGSADTQVKDSRPAEDSATIRRRRVCPACGGRFTTFERVQLRELTVIKRNGRRVPFDRDKLARSIEVAIAERLADGLRLVVRLHPGQGPTRIPVVEVDRRTAAMRRFDLRDDANVERLCDLLDSMASESGTRFLVVTHHPLTMARMHRLYGVTMQEPGVSKLVSVNLDGVDVSHSSRREQPAEVTTAS